MSRKLPAPSLANTTLALAQRAHRSSTDEHRQRSHHDHDDKRRSGRSAKWKMAPVTAACAVGLVLIALCAPAPKASGMPPASLHVTVAGSAEMRSGGGQFVARTATPGSGHHHTGHPTGQRAAIQPSATPTLPNETFDWADASVGAGFTLVLGLLVAGGALVSRGRMHGKVIVGKTRS